LVYLGKAVKHLNKRAANLKNVMKNTRVFYLVAILLYLNVMAVAQGDLNTKASAISTFNMFREPTAIAFGSGIGNMAPLIFEADIVPYFMLSLNNNVKWGIELSPRIILRMYNKESYPVSTPSFMPRVTGFYQFINSNDKRRDLFAFCSWVHHSNGQDGYFYNIDSTTINTSTGSFSTNWLEGGIFLSRPDPNLSYNTNYIKLSAAYNYQQEELLDDIYGGLRFYFNFKSTANLTKFFNNYAIIERDKSFLLYQSLNLGYIAGKMYDRPLYSGKRFIFKYTLSVKPSFLNNVNLFVQYYYGEDYYNIYFNQTLNVLRVGISTRSHVFN
jgi:hypothetical protein